MTEYARPDGRGLVGWWKEVVFEHYADFRGRARRSEYWTFTLVNVVLALAMNVVSFFAGSLAGAGSEVAVFALVGLSLAYLLYTLGVLIPGLAVGVRRLHDTGRSGWYLLIVLIPVVGAIALVVWLATEGQPGGNRYGPDPKSPARDDVVDHFGATV